LRLVDSIAPLPVREIYADGQDYDEVLLWEAEQALLQK